jgi:hypothetical protein
MYLHSKVALRKGSPHAGTRSLHISSAVAEASSSRGQRRSPIFFGSGQLDWTAAAGGNLNRRDSVARWSALGLLVGFGLQGNYSG